MKVIKRDGRKVEFDKQKITNAIEKAMERTNIGVNHDIALNITNKIYHSIKDKNKVTVEDIQDMVEEKLMSSSRKDAAKEFITYRNERTKVRNKDTELYNETRKILNCENVDNTNANIDQYSFSGKESRIGANFIQRFATDELLTDRVRKAKEQHYIYLHDYDKYSIGNHNCLFANVSKLLANGFRTRNGDVRPANSVSTAFQLIAVIFQCQSQVQFGGVASAHIDYDIAPYVKLSFSKHLKDGIEWVENITNVKVPKSVSVTDKSWEMKYPKAFNYATKMTYREGLQGAQAFYHNLNTLESRAGSQVPFTSINLGRDTSREGQLVSEWIFKASIDGIGKLHQTSIFPIAIFQHKKGVNDKEGTPNYYLKELAIKSMCKRIYPNWVNCDFSQHHEDVDDIDTYKCTMGCVDKDEVVTYKFKEVLYVESFKRMWNRIQDSFAAKSQGNSTYIDVTDVFIFDTKEGFVPVKRIIKNSNNVWIRLKFSNGRCLTVTDNHPLPIINKGRIIAKDLKIGDKIQTNNKQYSENTINFDTEKAWLLGFILCDGCYAGGHISSSIAFESENDIEKYYTNTMKNQFNIDVTTTERHRGVKGTYKDLIGHGENTIEVIQYLTQKYEGVNKNNRHVPNEVFSWNKNSQLAFLAGMIDADGYINPQTHGGSIVQIGSTNKELAIQQMLLAQALDMPAKLYLNKYNKRHPEKIRYRIEFAPTHELLDYIVSEKKVKNYVQNTNHNVHTVSELTEIEYLTDKNDDSYDVTTDSDHFEVSGIYSHNCRTQLGFDRHGMGYKQVGRGNICPTTMILPKLGIEYGICLGKRTEPDLKGFWKAFDEVLDITRESLLNRYAYISSQSPKSAPFMYENSTIADADKCTNNVEPAMKHGTLAFGFIGLAEMCEALFGTNFVHDKKVYNFALKVVIHIYDYAKECSEKYNLNFSNYFTPAEGLCEKAEKYLKDEYGVIPNVTDKKYLTNSTHVPVWEEMSFEKKLELEAPFTKYGLGGCITYGELNSDLSKNPKGVEDIINRAMDMDIPYLALNFPIDTCQDCGYQGKMDDECPNCHGHNIIHIARVTGYLSTDVSHFNEGKQAEVKDRVTHDYSVDFGGDVE